MAKGAKRRNQRKRLAATLKEKFQKVEAVEKLLEMGEGAGPALTGRAIRERWPIRDEIRPALINAMSLVALTPENRVRDRVTAARTCIDADKLNFAQEGREAGGDNLNVHIEGEVNATVVITDEQRAAALSRLYARLGGSNGSADTGGDGNGTRPILHSTPPVDGRNGSTPRPLAGSGPS
jgi:hypothetical protein